MMEEAEVRGDPTPFVARRGVCVCVFEWASALGEK